MHLRRHVRGPYHRNLCRWIRLWDPLIIRVNDLSHRLARSHVPSDGRTPSGQGVVGGAVVAATSAAAPTSVSD